MLGRISFELTAFGMICAGEHARRDDLAIAGRFAKSESSANPGLADLWVTLAIVSLLLGLGADAVHRWPSGAGRLSGPLQVAAGLCYGSALLAGLALAALVPWYRDPGFAWVMLALAVALPPLRWPIPVALLAPVRGLGVALFLSAALGSGLITHGLAAWLSVASQGWAYVLWSLAAFVVPVFNARWPRSALDAGIWPWLGLGFIAVGLVDVGAGPAALALRLLVASGYLFILLGQSAWPGWAWGAVSGIAAAGGVFDACALLDTSMRRGLRVVEFLPMVLHRPLDLGQCPPVRGAIMAAGVPSAGVAAEPDGWGGQNLDDAVHGRGVPRARARVPGPRRVRVGRALLAVSGRAQRPGRVRDPPVPHAGLVDGPRASPVSHAAHDAWLGGGARRGVVGRVLDVGVLDRSRRWRWPASLSWRIRRGVSPAYRPARTVGVAALVRPGNAHGHRDVGPLLERPGARATLGASHDDRPRRRSRGCDRAARLADGGARDDDLFLHAWPLAFVPVDRAHLLLPWYALELALLALALQRHGSPSAAVGRSPLLDLAARSWPWLCGMAVIEWSLHLLALADALAAGSPAARLAGPWDGIAALIAAASILWIGLRRVRDVRQSPWTYAAFLWAGALGFYLRLLLLGLGPVTLWDTATLIVVAYGLVFLQRYFDSRPLLHLAYLMPLAVLMTVPPKLASVPASLGLVRPDSCIS